MDNKINSKFKKSSTTTTQLKGKKYEHSRNLKFASQGNYNVTETLGGSSSNQAHFLVRSKMKATSRKLEREDNSIRLYLLDLKHKLNGTMKEKVKESNYSVNTPFFIPDPEERILPLRNEMYDVSKNNNFLLTNSLVDQIYQISQSSENAEEDRSFLENSNNKIYTALSFGKRLVEERRRSNEEYLLTNELVKCYTKNMNLDFTFQNQDTERELCKFRNVYDSMSDDEFEELIDENNRCLIHPKSRFKMVWDGLCAFLIFYSIILTPYRLAFYFDDESDTYVFIELFIDIFFMSDLILNFFTPFYKHEILVTSSKKIVSTYLCSWFIIDLISSTPIGLVFFIIQQVSNHTQLLSLNKISKISRILRFYRLLKWIRIFRVLKLSTKGGSQFWKKLTKIFDNNFFKFLLTFMIIVYLTSCIWCFLGKINESIYYFNTTWIKSNNMTDDDNSTIFVASVYFVCSTIFTIGYGDIHATNWMEKLFILLLMIIGSLTWSFLLTSLSYVFSHKEERQIIYDKKLKILEELNMEYQLDQKIFNRLRKFLFYEYNIYNKDQVSFLETLPGNLKNQLYLNMYEKHISKLQFFKDQSYDFIIAVLPLLKHTRYLKDECIINIGSVVEGVYMLIRGSLGIYLGSFYKNREIAKITSSYHIGDILMYSDDQSPYDVKVKTRQAELLVLSKKDFACLKLQFKDPIKKILTKSYEIHRDIENKKEAALRYHKSKRTLQGFRYNARMKNYSPTIFNPMNQIIEEYEEDEIFEKKQTFQNNYKNLVNVVNNFSKASHREKPTSDFSTLGLETDSPYKSTNLGTIELTTLPNKDTQGAILTSNESIDKNEPFLIDDNSSSSPKNKETQIIRQNTILESQEEELEDLSPTSIPSVTEIRAIPKKSSKNTQLPENNFIRSDLIKIRRASKTSKCICTCEFHNFHHQVNTRKESGNIKEPAVKTSIKSGEVGILQNLRLKDLNLDDNERPLRPFDNGLVTTKNKKNSKISAFNDILPKSPASKSRDVVLKEKSFRYSAKSIQMVPRGSVSPKLRNTRIFLNSINERIENDGIMFKNGEIISEYIRDKLRNEKKEDQKIKSAFTRLEKLEQKLKGMCKVST